MPATSASHTTTKTTSPKRLVDLCIRFVAKHLNQVESFVEFPDQIGQQIFAVAVSLGMFEQTSRSGVANMKLFCDAYGHHVLGSLNLKENHLVVNNHLDSIHLFTQLTELDVTSCGLGDEHPLIRAISDIHSLLVLYLKNNALSDSGIRRMTSPMRMFQKGPMNLQKLDISENADITTKGVMYLKVFSQLDLVDLSRTSVEVNQILSFEKDMQMVQTTDRSSVEVLFPVKTAGWAAVIIDAWIRECHEKQKLNASKRKRPHFYGKVSRGMIENVKPDHKQSFQSAGNSLILTKQLACSDEQKTDKSDTFSQTGLPSIDVYPKLVDNISKHTNKTLKIDNEYTKQRVNKKRSHEESTLRDSSDEEEDKLLMEMYSGVSYRKQHRLSDLY